MTADIQPPVAQSLQRFGASGLGLSPSVRQSGALIRQMPAIAISTALAARGLMLQQNQPALVELGGDWIRVVLAQKPNIRHAVSVFDMPPLDLGRVYRPLSSRSDLMEEMLGDARF
jgi:hypothetical protein